MAEQHYVIVPNMDRDTYERYKWLMGRKRKIAAEIKKLLDKAGSTGQPLWTCKRCDASWYGKNPNIRPRYCARCGSAYWHKDRKKPVGWPTRHVAEVKVAAPDEQLRQALEVIHKYGGRKLLSGLTPPPASVFEEPVHEEIRAVDVVEGETHPGEEPPEVTAESDSSELRASIPRGVEEAHCCARPTIVDGICINCGDGLGRLNGNHAG